MGRYLVGRSTASCGWHDGGAFTLGEPQLFNISASTTVVQALQTPVLYIIAITNPDLLPKNFEQFAHFLAKLHVATHSRNLQIVECLGSLVHPILQLS
jgi:hypothetical protein